ncbi:zinc finger protein 275-like [Sardina pilchardus]|uniref:zinc finger protein 275-like n=1 Tax=Sardina pilchardus TaxID=27697 RepID=UPI002E15C248
MASVEMVFQTHVKGLLDAVVNVLVEEITDLFRTCLALEQNTDSVSHASSHIGLADPAELQHRLGTSLKSTRQSGPSPGCDEPLPSVIRTPTPPSVCRQGSSRVLPQCSSAHDACVADSKVRTDLPVVIEMVDTCTLFPVLTSGQNERGLQQGPLELGSKAVPTVSARTEYEIEIKEEKPFTGHEGELKLNDSSAPLTEGSVSSLELSLPLKMEVESTELDECGGPNEAGIVDHTPPQPSTPDGHLACPSESGKAPDHAPPAVVIEGARDVRKGLEEVKRPNEEIEDEEEVEEEDGSSDIQACLSGSEPNMTQTSSGPIVEEVGVYPEQVVERAGEDGGVVPPPLSCPSPRRTSLPLPPCYVPLDRLPSRFTSKKKTLLVCPDCAKVFRCAKSLHKHRRFHSGEKPFHCPQCPRRFILRKSLRRHLRRHTGEKPYRCPQCGKAFRLRRGLEKHKHKHARHAHAHARPGPC